MAAGDRALAARRPDPAQDRLQADPVLVGGEGLDHRAGMALRLLGDGLGELFLNAACSSGVAASRVAAAAGAGSSSSIARSASQPRCSATPAPELGRHEGRHLLRGPDPAVVGRASSAAPEAPRASPGSAPSASAPLPPPPVAEARRPEGIVARQQLLDPAPREARQLGHLGAAPPLPPAARSPGSAAPASRPRFPDSPPAIPPGARCPTTCAMPAPVCWLQASYRARFSQGIPRNPSQSRGDRISRRTFLALTTRPRWRSSAPTRR